jgi:hypothetical protein
MTVVFIKRKFGHRDIKKREKMVISKPKRDPSKETKPGNALILACLLPE